jgi:hypothetical protein
MAFFSAGVGLHLSALGRYSDWDFLSSGIQSRRHGCSEKDKFTEDT